MAKRRKVGNPLALAVLAFLLMKPMHPYELGRILKETGKDKDIKYNRGSLYMVVQQLAKAGFVQEHETVRDTQRPERTVYALTDSGRDEMYDWMRELVAEPQHEYPLFGVALSLLSVLSPAESAELLTQRLRRLTELTEDLRSSVKTALDGGLAWWFLVEDEYRVALIEGERTFVKTLIESMGKPEYIRAWNDMFGERT